MTNTNSWWKQNRIRVLRTLLSERGAIGGGGSTFILLGISFGIILLAGVGKITWPAAQTELSITSYGDSFKMEGRGIIDMKAKVCRLLTPAEAFQRIAKIPAPLGSLGGN